MSKSAVERPVDGPGQAIAGTLRRNGRHIMANWIRELALLPVIVLLLVIGAFVNPAFLTANNFINVAQESAALGAVVVAETLILLTGKFDLSLQATYGLAPMVGAWLIVSKDGQGLGTNWNPFLGIADRKSTRLNSSHTVISYAVFCLQKKQTDVRPLDIHIRRSA